MRGTGGDEEAGFKPSVAGPEGGYAARRQRIKQKQEEGSSSGECLSVY